MGNFLLRKEKNSFAIIDHGIYCRGFNKELLVRAMDSDAMWTSHLGSVLKELDHTLHSPDDKHKTAVDN